MNDTMTEGSDQISDAPFECSQSQPSSYLLLFGGYDDMGFRNDTWQWDGANWTELWPVHNPPARYGAVMTTLCGQGVLFGGSGQSGYLNDTWTWDGNDWTPQTLLVSPDVRFQAVFATLNGTATLFGGYSSDLTMPAFSDTWTWDGIVWGQMTSLAVHPGLRGGASASALGGMLILFGGDPVEPADGAPPFLADTWSWDGTAWQELTVTPSPSERTWAAAATLQNAIILFGGYDGQQDLNDTWAWTGTSWSRLNPLTFPTVRDTPAMATMGQTIVLFGGENVDGEFSGDTWIWDGSDWSSPSVSGPSARMGSAVTAF
jgi:hypothetical protein